MFDMMSKPGFSSDFQFSLPSAFSNSTLMKDSSFQDDRRPWLRRPDDEANGGSYRMCLSDVEDDDGLELSLGLSVGGSSSKLKKSSKLQKKPSGNFSPSPEAPTSYMRENATGELAAADQALPVDLHALLNLPHGRRKDQKNYEGSLCQSRDQVWEALQKENVLSPQDTMHVEGAAALQELKHASASLWGRRSSSMQLVVPMKEGSEGALQPIKRLNSNGASANMNMMPKLYDSAPAPPSRQVSSVESLLEKCNETATTCQQQQEALELQRKKEMQALRRQEARRRRKCLIEEKQHKKARKDDRGPPLEPRSCLSTSPQKISSACMTTQEGSLSSRQVIDVHQRRANKETLQSAPDKSDFFGIRSGDDDYNIEDHVVEAKSLDLGTSTESSAERKARKRGAFVEEYVEMEVLQRSDSCADLQPLFTGGSEQETTSRRFVHHPPSTQRALSAPRSEALNMAVQPTDQNVAVGFNEEAGRICHSSTSETESGDTIEEHSAVQNECGEIDASSSKCVTTAEGSAVSFPPMNSLAYPPPFPVMPIPYPISVPGAPSAAIPLQLGFSLPCFMQYPVAGGGENSISSPSQLSASFPDHGSAALPPYRFPMPDVPFPWFPVVPAGGAAPQPALSQPQRGTPGKRSSSNECKGKCLEDAEKPLPSKLSVPPVTPFRRSSSKSHTKDQAGALPVPSPKRPDCQAPVPAALRKLAGGPSSAQHERKKESPSVNWNLPVDRQHSLPVAARLSSQDTGAVEQSSLKPHSEVHTLSACGESRCDNESRDKSRNCGSRNVLAGLKQEEGSADSQLGSENSGLEASIEQPVALDGQKSGTIPDLPWVSTTGVGPKGKTISGVMYVTDSRQIRLVCSCHGKHMSPAEFVEHSGSIDLSNPERNILVNAFPFLSQVATTPV